jgi:5'-3' exonuclease
MIENLEPYSNMLKEEIRECNRQICEIEGVESISDTNFEQECVYKYGYDKPN